MSVSKWAYEPEKCDGEPCVGDCDICSKQLKKEAEEKRDEINELKEQVKIIEKRIKQLSAPPSIGHLVKTPIWTWKYNGYSRQYEPELMDINKNRQVWDALRPLCTALFGRNINTKDLTREQAQIAAEMVDEFIKLYNRYFDEINDPRETIVLNDE